MWNRKNLTNNSLKSSKENKNLILYSSRPGLRPGSLDRNPKIKRETKNITTV